MKSEKSRRRPAKTLALGSSGATLAASPQEIVQIAHVGSAEADHVEAPVPAARMDVAARQSLVAAAALYRDLSGRVSDTATLAPTIPRDERVDRFIVEGKATLDQNGHFQSIGPYLRAVALIQSKALALGYGDAARSAAIDSVPAGFVGRYERHDIYAAA